MGWERKILGIALAIVIIIAGTVIASAITNKPLIDYTIVDPANQWNFNSGSLKVILGLRNRGGIDASVSLIVTVSNAVVSSAQSTPSQDFNQTTLRIQTIAINGQKDYAEYYAFITPNFESTNFTVSYSLERAMSDLMSSFAQITRWTPTTLTYNRTDTMTYTLIVST
jgi:hypothetical protein